MFFFSFQFPISFAINFTVTSEKNILAPQCAVPKAAEQKETKTQSAQPKQSDEADTGRLAVSTGYVLPHRLSIISDYDKSINDSGRLTVTIYERINRYTDS